MVADYSHQLEQIVQALNRTSTPWWQHPWILAGVAAMFGVVGGLIGQIILLGYTTRSKLRTMRRMAYADVGELATVVNQVLLFPGFDDSPEGQFKMKEHYRVVAPRMSEDYVKANPDIFAELPERISYDAILSLHRELLAGPYDFKGYLRTTMIVIALHFEQQRLSINLVRKFSGKEAAELLSNIFALYDTSAYSASTMK